MRSRKPGGHPSSSSSDFASFKTLATASLPSEGHHLLRAGDILLHLHTSSLDVRASHRRVVAGTQERVTRRAIATWPFLKSEPRNQVRTRQTRHIADSFESLHLVREPQTVEAGVGHHGVLGLTSDPTAHIDITVSAAGALELLAAAQSSLLDRGACRPSRQTPGITPLFASPGRTRRPRCELDQTVCQRDLGMQQPCDAYREPTFDLTGAPVASCAHKQSRRWWRELRH
jgi:hypothetical protein